MPRAGPAESLAVRISHLIVWISGTGVSAAPCPVPSHGLVGSGKTEPGIGKGQAGRSQDLQVAQGEQSPKGAATVPLPKAGKSSAARIPIPAPPAAGSSHSCSLHFCSTQRSRCPVCWPGGLLLPGAGLSALQAHGQHPPGPPTLPATALLPGSAQRHRPLPEHGAGGCCSSAAAALLPAACAGSQPR